jgi:hypothetical protein
VAGRCEHRNELSDYIKDGEFFDQLLPLDSYEAIISV